MQRSQFSPRTAVRNLLLALAAPAVLVLFVLWAHLGSGSPVFTAATSITAGWAEFRDRMGVTEFGEDGYFARAVQHGYNLFYYTDRFAARFVRSTPDAQGESCSDCHQVEQLAYAFVNSDRQDPVLGRRVSFEERVMRCYVGRMDGFVPTIYDPAVRDIRILARMVAHRLNLAEGALQDDV